MSIKRPKCPKCKKEMKPDYFIVGFTKIYEQYKCECGMIARKTLIWHDGKWISSGWCYDEEKDKQG